MSIEIGDYVEITEGKFTGEKGLVDDLDEGLVTIQFLSCNNMCTMYPTRLRVITKHDAIVQKECGIATSGKKAFRSQTGCGRTLPISEFYKNKTARDGHDTVCKHCRRTAQRGRYTDRREVHQWTNRERIARDKLVGELVEIIVMLSDVVALHIDDEYREEQDKLFEILEELKDGK